MKYTKFGYFLVTITNWSGFTRTNFIDATIAENIGYGLETSGISKDKIIEAAKQANIHDFIIKIPKVYIYIGHIIKTKH
jgi:ABC-type multidrug transport system fused ATPase/permease subunit